MVVNFDSLFREGELQALEGEFWDAVDVAKEDAAFKQTRYILSWDEETHSFLLESGEYKGKFEVDTSNFGEDVELAVSFTEALPENGYVLIGGRLVTDRDIEQVMFYPDGTCTPFTVVMAIAGYESSIRIDPWTGAEMVSIEDGI